MEIGILLTFTFMVALRGSAIIKNHSLNKNEKNP